MKPSIRILPSHQVDHDQWDQCVNLYANGLIYSAAGYLNIMADNWHGLVIDKYKAVMALPWKKKFGIRYLYTPAFSQQHGLIGDITNTDMTEVLNAIKRFVSYGDMHLNFADQQLQKILSTRERTNLVIDLNNSYHSIYAGYRSDVSKNCRKAATQNLQYAEAGITDAICHFRQQYGSRIQQLQEEDYLHFAELCKVLQKKKQCLVRSVQTKEKGVAAIAVLLQDNKRIYNLMNTTLPMGRDMRANHWLLDRIIHEFSDQALLFDMEGSDLSGVQAFYRGFGAINQPYFHYHFNQLPWLPGMLKR